MGRIQTPLGLLFYQKLKLKKNLLPHINEDCTRHLVAEVGQQTVKMTSSSGATANSALNNMKGGWVSDNSGKFEFYGLLPK